MHALLPKNRPPVVQENLQWSPHRDPTEDQQALSQQSAVMAVADQSPEQLCSDAGNSKEGQPDAETDHAPLHQPTQVALQQPGSPRKVNADRGLNRARFFGWTGSLVEMNHQIPIRPRVEFSDAVDDLLFSVVIQVLFEEGRGVQGIEQLAQLTEANMDLAGASGALIAQSWLPQRIGPTAGSLRCGTGHKFILPETRRTIFQISRMLTGTNPIATEATHSRHVRIPVCRNRPRNPEWWL